MKNNKASEIPKATVLPSLGRQTIGSGGACGEWQKSISLREGAILDSGHMRRWAQVVARTSPFSEEAGNLDFCGKYPGFSTLARIYSKHFKPNKTHLQARLGPRIPVYKPSSRPYSGEVHMTCCDWDGFKAKSEVDFPLSVPHWLSRVLSRVWLELGGSVYVGNRPAPPTHQLFSGAVSWPLSSQRVEISGRLAQNGPERNFSFSASIPTPRPETKMYGC